MKWNKPKQQTREPDYFWLEKLDVCKCFRYSSDLEIPGTVKVVDENGVLRHAIKSNHRYEFLKDHTIYQIWPSGSISELWQPETYVRK